MVSAPGLVGASAVTTDVESFTLTAAAAPVGVPDSNLEVPFTIENNGTTDANFALNATDVPQNFTVTFDPANGTVTAGNSTNVTANVQIPADASPGDYSFNVTVAGPNGGNTTVTVSFLVESATLSSTVPTTNATAASPASASENGNGAPFAPTPLVIAALLACAILIRRRRA